MVRFVVALTISAAPGIAGPQSYFFDFGPTPVLQADATFLYFSAEPTAPGTTITVAAATPQVGLDTSAFGSRQSDGTWEFGLNPIDPHAQYLFRAETDLSFPNTPGIFTVASIESFSGICIPCPPSGPDPGTVTITITDLPEAGSWLLLCAGLLALIASRPRLTRGCATSGPARLDDPT